MITDQHQRARLVADVGGTNTRIALFDPRNAQMRALATYVNRDHASLQSVIAGWLAQLDEPAPPNCCIAAAAPPSNDLVTMINMDWSFSCTALASQFGFARVRWLNDFQANAHSLPHLTADDSLLLRAGSPDPERTLAVMGPGTGLGGATLEWIGGSPHACDSEPGHMGLSPANELELEIFQRLVPRHGELHAEFLVSGIGLTRLYQVLAKIRGEQAEPLSPAAVSERALAEQDPCCVQTLEIFCELLGSTCGDFVLANGAYGGMYLAGGILPRMTEFLRSSGFVRRFQEKGAMRPHLEQVPLHIITAKQPGLIGAAHAPLQGTAD